MEKDITERVRRTQDKAMECLDYILETNPTLDFIEIAGCFVVMRSLTGCIMTAQYMRNGQGIFYDESQDDPSLFSESDGVLWLDEGDFEWP